MRRGARRAALLGLLAAGLFAGDARPTDLAAEAVPPTAIRWKRLPGTRPAAAALLSSTNAGGVLDFRFTAATGEIPGGAAEVVFEAIWRQLFAGVESPRVTVELTVYALDAGGGVVAAQATAVVVDRARLAPALDGAALRIVDRIVLPPSTRALRALLYCRESGAFALRRVDLKPGGNSADPVAALPDPAAGWIEIPLGTAVKEASQESAAAPIGAPLPQSANEASVPTDASPAASEPDVEDLAAALRETYRLSTAGDRDDAVLRLVAIERAVVDEDPKRGLVRLDRATGRVLAAIERADPGLLLVLALFHQQAAVVERRERQNGLAQRNEGLALFLLERLARSRPADRELAAAALSGLALPYLESPAPQRAGVLLERALRLGGDVPMRLIVLAAVRTREGDSREARALLDRALAAAPDNREAALRRAIADFAAGEADRAERPLRRLCTEGKEPATDWIALLACQELARIELAAGRFAEAEALLSKSLARWPAEPSLLLAQAFVQRKLGRRAEASALALRTLAVGPPVAIYSGDGRADGDSPRTRYVQGPRAYLLTQRYAAEQAAAFRAGALATALAEGGRKPARP